MQGFKKFLLRGNLVELAVAVVIGVAFSALIAALVKDLITPLIAAIGGKPDFSQLYFTVNKSKFAYGDFLDVVISFIIIAAVVYFLVVLPVAKLFELTRRNEEATERECPECLSSVPKGARRCRYCTTQLTPEPETQAGAETP
ncbi:MAG TPA: large conductance mechanosensitive channel protein MscL [Streptosporangiaceae bacterium]|nr:large conductance mechanosensitive channel protein MscL [Streptosporangiaceae bacterium]